MSSSYVQSIVLRNDETFLWSNQSLHLRHTVCTLQSPSSFLFLPHPPSPLSERLIDKTKGFFQHVFRSLALFKPSDCGVSVAWQRRVSNLSWHWWKASGTVQELQLNTQRWECWLRPRVHVCVSVFTVKSFFLPVRQRTEASLRDTKLRKPLGEKTVRGLLFLM